ncbi:hypothetical protein EOM86_11050 [Candidatus Nomurabacteria bacterium]|nr:hypothetical protein [Candidatus Nomurabacteria bacterium]
MGIAAKIGMETSINDGVKRLDFREFPHICVVAPAHENSALAYAMASRDIKVIIAGDVTTAGVVKVDGESYIPRDLPRLPILIPDCIGCKSDSRNNMDKFIASVDVLAEYRLLSEKRSGRSSAQRRAIHRAFHERYVKFK